MVERSVKSVLGCFKRRFKSKHEESADVPRESSERSMKGVLESRAWQQERAGLFQEEAKSVASRACWNAVSVGIPKRLLRV